MVNILLTITLSSSIINLSHHFMFFNEYSRLSYYLMTLEGVIFKDSNLLAADLYIFIY